MSIHDLPCVLRNHLETQVQTICRDGAVEDQPGIHPEHMLQPIDRRDPFYCMACKEIGFWRSYSCERCAVYVHRECVSPTPAMPHPLLEYSGDLSFVRSVKTYDTDADADAGGKFCGAWSKPLRGCGYMSAGGESCFHPCCLHLDRFIKVNGDGAVEYGPWIHPEHTLQPIDRRDPFYCMACKEIGFWRSYSCEPCAVHVHKECVSPPPVMPHPLPVYSGDLSFVRSVKTCDADADADADGGGKFCGACSKALRGCGYMSAGGKSCFHPCCLRLDRFIKVNGEKLKLKTKNIPSKCNWCKKELIRDQRRTVIPSWSYVSGGKNRRFHVGCVQDMMLESWRDGGIDQPVRGKEEDSTANFTTCLSFKIKLPIDPEEERDADPLESATQKLTDYLLKVVRDGNDPLAVATGDQANEVIELLSDALETLKSGVESATKKEADPKMDIRLSKSEKQKAVKSGVGSGSCKVWERTKFLWRKLLLKIRQGIAWLADTPVGRAGREAWTTVTQPSKLWELIRPLLQWLHSKLCELASRMLIGTSLPAGRLLYDAQAYSTN